jgi:hypothetical protein
MATPTPTCHLDTLLAAEIERAQTDTNQPLSEETRIAIDLAHLQWKQSGGPIRDHDERAIAIERGSRRHS